MLAKLIIRGPKMFRKGVVCAALLAAVTGAHAAPNWVQVGASVDSKVFIDTSSISRSGNMARVWLDSVYTPPTMEFGTRKPVRQNKARWTFNCADQTSNAGGFALYDVNGNLLFSGDSSNNWMDVVPDSLGDDAMKAACGK